MKKINFGGLYKNMLGIIGAMEQEVSILKEKLLWNFMWEH